MWGSGVFQPQHLVVQRRKTGSIRLGRSEKVPTWVYTILQTLSLTLFEKIPLNVLLTHEALPVGQSQEDKQLILL